MSLVPNKEDLAGCWRHPSNRFPFDHPLASTREKRSGCVPKDLLARMAQVQLPGTLPHLLSTILPVLFEQSHAPFASLQSTRQRSGFIKLPTEVRLQIYRYVFQDSRDLVGSRPSQAKGNLVLAKQAKLGPLQIKSAMGNSTDL